MLISYQSQNMDSTAYPQGKDLFLLELITKVNMLPDFGSERHGSVEQWVADLIKTVSNCQPCSLGALNWLSPGDQKT